MKIDIFGKCPVCGEIHPVIVDTTKRSEAASWDCQGFIVAIHKDRMGNWCKGFKLNPISLTVAKEI